MPSALLYSVLIRHREFRLSARVYVNDRFSSSAVEDKKVIVSVFRGGSSALDALRFQHFPYHNRERGGHADV